MKYATKKLTMATTSMRRMNLIMVDECARGAGEVARSYCQARSGSGWLCAEFVNKFAIRTRFVRWRRRLSGGGTLATQAGPAVVWNAGCRVDKSCSNLDCWLASRCAGSVYDDDPFSGRCRGCHDIPYASSCRADPSVAARRASAALALLASLLPLAARRRRRRAPAWKSSCWKRRTPRVARQRWQDRPDRDQRAFRQCHRQGVPEGL